MAAEIQLFGVGRDDEDRCDVPVHPRQRAPRDPWPASREPLDLRHPTGSNRLLFGSSWSVIAKIVVQWAGPKARTADASPKHKIWRGQ